MNVSKAEQRVLRALARGGRIEHHRDENGRLIEIDCFTREGWRLSDCDLPLFLKLRRRRLITSRDDGPYLIPRQGLSAVRAQPDNR